MTEKMFPIKSEHSIKERLPGGAIPWAVAEVAYREYSRRYINGQSLERLAERGGFGWYELAMLLCGEHENRKKP